ncbi:MAG: universal stress protein [Magnetococcales bacterium]|nr:universal stress protein [Magnetococcales bacterium]
MSLKNCKKIIVAVDFSDDSKTAVNEGLTLAKMTGAEIVLHHVIHDLADQPGFYHKKKDKKRSIHLMSDAAEEMMADFVKKSGVASSAKKAKLKLTTSISKGLPHDGLLKLIKKSKADAIVVGTSGRSGLTKLLMGSTAQRVTQMAKIPVIVVRK